MVARSKKLLRAQGPKPKITGRSAKVIRAENARVGYQSAIALWTYQGNLNWSRFNVMLTANSIILAVIGVAFTSQRSLPVFTLSLPLLGLVSLPVSTRLLPLLGLFLCAAWFLLTVRGYDFQRYWSRSALELEEKYLANSVKTVSRSRPYGKGEEILLEIGGESIPLRMGLWSRFAESQRRISYLVIVVFAVLYVVTLVQG
jgi:hypothetical protein